MSLRQIVLEKDGKWWAVRVNLFDGALHMSGYRGRIVDRRWARAAVLRQIAGEFGYSRELQRYSERVGRTFALPLNAAKFKVSQANFKFGDILPIFAEKADHVLYQEGCEYTDKIARIFPEIAPYVMWNNNDQKEMCEHQHAANITNGRCNVCGHKYGWSYVTWKLPPEVVAWAQTVGEEVAEESA